ncbi:type VII secretion protein EccE [Actinoplanes sp. HUAS TT8]|uniref:type VII secretion protein EccE n=1 Tax=Actinoplanes sp. HUAS TT8 TaxID=3447453 RepID=UPI003F520A88
MRVAADLTAPRRVAGRPGVRLHQVIATQAAAVLVLVGIAASGPARFLAMACAVLALILTWSRARGHWAFEWLGAGLRFRAARRPAGTVFDRVAPGTRVTSIDLPGGPVAVLDDGSGLTVLLEVGDPADLLAGTSHELTAPWEIVAGDNRERPSCRVQLLLSAAPAATAGTGPIVTSYRALADGRAFGHARAVLAVRVRRDEGGSDVASRRALTGLVRKLTKRLTAHPLDRAAAIRTITDFAYGVPAAEVHEEWSSLRVGDLSQTTFHTSPEAGVTPSAELLTRLLRLPVAATTVALTAELPESGSADPLSISLAVRLTASDPAALESAAASVRRLVALRRRDGDHLRGLAATLPLGASGRPLQEEYGWHPKRASPASPRFDRLVLPTTWSGVVVGRNRHGNPLPIRLFRTEPTRMLLVSGLRCAQLLVFRSLAVGARVLVRTRRPREWAAFARGTAADHGTIVLAPPDHPVEPPPGTPLRPLLTILDTGPAVAARPALATSPWSDPLTTPGSGIMPRPSPRATPWPEQARGLQPGPAGVYPVPPRPHSADAEPAAAGANSGAQTWAGGGDPRGPWEATVTLRETFDSTDVTAASDADLVLLQPLLQAEADLVGTALHLGEVVPLIVGMRPDMIGVISHQAVRWATISPTDIEKVLIGDPNRTAGER